MKLESLPMDMSTHEQSQSFFYAVVKADMGKEGTWLSYCWTPNSLLCQQKQRHKSLAHDLPRHRASFLSGR